MSMGIQVFLTVFIVSITLGAEPELHIRAVHLCTPTDCTLVLCNTTASLHFPFKLLSSVDLLRIQVHHVPGGQEKDNKIQQ